MSFVIENSQESPKTRLYSRGNDKVELDLFIRLAESGFNSWLDKTDIKDKYKKLVRSAYQDLINRINDDPESFVAKLGGGFTNTAGITNATKGFDAYGVAAWYLGETLRGMHAYTEPVSNKTKYNRDSAIITPTMQNQIWGNNSDNFVRLDDDSYDEKTGLRGITNRLTWTISGLENLKSKLGDYYDFESEEDYNNAISRIDSAIKLLKEDTDLNNDWFVLGLLGMTNMDKFFYTGKPLNPTKPIEQLAEQQDVSLVFNLFVTENYPIYSGTLHSPVSLYEPDKLPVSNNDLIKFKNEFDRFNDNDLKNWMREYISNIDSYDVNNNQYMRRIYPHGIPNFSTEQIINTILLRMKDRNLLKQFAPNSTKYYIPGTASKKGVAYVWDTSDGGSLQQMKLSDIPYWQEKMLNEFLLKYPQFAILLRSHKKGGILKANSGLKLSVLEALTYLPEDLTPDKRIQNKYLNGTFDLITRTDQAKDTIAVGNNHYNPEDGGVLLELQDYYKNWLTILKFKPEVAEAFARRYRDLQPTSDVHYKSWFNSDDSFNFDNFKSSTVYNDGINGIGHDFYRGRVYQIIDENGNPLDGYYSSSDGYEVVGNPELDSSNLAWVYQMRKKKNPAEYETDEPIDRSDPSLQGDLLDEVPVETNGNNLTTPDSSNQGGIWGEVGIGLLGAGRLAGSIYNNNRIARIVRESLKPKLHNTYELYSPVTGAFSEMLLRNNQAADVLSQSYRPFTSDASLAAARMLEGLINANLLQHQGFIADDREIKRTQSEALSRLENNIARRSALANENMDAIITNNLALAQLESSRIKQNWQSADNYLQGVEGRIRQYVDYNIAELREKEKTDELNAETFLITQDLLQNEKRYLSELDKIDDLISNWEIKHPTLSSIKLPWYTQVSRRRAELADRLRDDNLASMARMKNWTYNSTYENNPYLPKDWSKIILKNGGRLISSNLLIDKIIRKNNESNS